MKSHLELKTSRVANEKTNKCKVVRGSKPLVNFKFYLDIEKHTISLKIESKIRDLGGSIEFFLTKDVTHFITDKFVDNNTCLNSPYTPSTPQTPISLLSEIGGNSVNNDIKGGGKIKSRADAMLQRARKGINESSDKSSVIQKSPTETAKGWGTPIWHPDYALKFFEKVCDAIKERCKEGNNLKLRHKSGNTRVLKGNFIKVEAFQKQFRPYYQLIKGSWPVLSLKIGNDFGAFQHSDDKITKACEDIESNRLNMTRKNRSKHIRVKQNSKISSDKQCGFCEICRVEYDVLPIHLKTDEHLNFVKNDKNFIELDSLIKSSANVNKFLSINKNLFNSSNCEAFPKRSSKRCATNQVTNDSQIPLNMIKHVKRSALSNSLNAEEKNFVDSKSHFVRHTRQSIIRHSINTPETKSTNSEPIGVFRSRRESLKKINYAEPKEDEENSDDAIFQIQKKKRGLGKISEINNKSNDMGNTKLKLPVSVLYKVVDTTEQSKPSTEKKEHLTKNNSDQTSSIIVKLKKVRTTQLTILNSEAENFMFPKKVSSELSTDVDRQTSSDPRNESSEGVSSSDHSSSIKRKCQTEKLTSNGLKNGIKRKKLCYSLKRNVSTEKEKGRSSSFLSAPIPQSKRKYIRKKVINNNIDTVDSPLDDGMGGEHALQNLENILKNNLCQYKFAFERVPCSEPWYQVFNRQDESQERVFEYFGSTVYRKLPYEMGPLPPLPPECGCTSTFNTKELSDNVSSRLKKELQELRNVNKEKEKSDKPKNIQIDISKKEKHLNKSGTLLNLEMPRKSPRDHPSTLAILSCLVQQKDDKQVLEETSLTDSQSQIENCNISGSVKSNKNEKDLINNENISSQISENVKRLRRGEKLLLNKLAPFDDNDKKDSKKINLSRSKRKMKKPLEFSEAEKKLYQIDDKFVDVNRLKKEIDTYLSEELKFWEENDESIVDLQNAVETISDEIDLIELIPDGQIESSKIRNSNTIANKLRLYKMFAMNKKRKNNKTGWPKKKRVITRQQNIAMSNLNGLSRIELSCKVNDSKDNEGKISAQSPITPPETDAEEKVERESNSVVYKDENTNFTFISGSDRADNSDIFTVSSDSLDTVLDVGSQIKSAVQKEIIASRKCTGHVENIDSTFNGSCKEKTNNVKRKSRKYHRLTFTRRKVNVNRRKSKSNELLQENNELKNISNSHLAVNDRKSASNSPQKNNISSTTSPSPISPRRLRKPRGRWYRER